MDNKTGISIIIYDHYEMVCNAIDSILVNARQPYHFLVVINNSNNKEINNLPYKYNDQLIEFYKYNGNGGLSGAWNTASHYLFDKFKCNHVVLCNHDIIVDHTFSKFQDALIKYQNYLGTFGPLTNKIGTDYTKKQMIKSKDQIKKDLVITEVNNAYQNSVNGFCFGINKMTYQTMVHQYGFLFDEKRFQWGGNEEDFGLRLKKIGGRPYVVESCFIRHLKLDMWRKTNQHSKVKIKDVLDEYK